MGTVKPYVKIVVTLQEVGSDESITISGTAKDAQLVVDDVLDLQPFTGLALWVEPSSRRKLRVEGEIVADYTFSTLRPDAELERLRAVERRVQAATVAGVDAIVRDAAWHMLNYSGDLT